MRLVKGARGLQAEPPLPPHNPQDTMYLAYLLRLGVPIAVIAGFLLATPGHGGETQENMSPADVGMLALFASGGQGHAIDMHVTISDQGLKDRIITEGKKSATKFYSFELAGETVANILSKAANDIAGWVANGMQGNFVTTYDMGKELGYGYVRTSNGPELITNPLTTGTVVLKSNGNGGWYILTAYPGE